MRHVVFALVFPFAILGFAAGCKKDKEEDEDDDPARTAVISNTQGNVNDTPPDDDPKTDGEDDDDDIVPPIVSVPLVVDCSGVNCGATDATTYAGSGVGIWKYVNTTTKVKTVNVALSGVDNTDMTLVVTNLESSAVDLPDYTANNSTAAGLHAKALSSGARMEWSEPLATPFRAPYDVTPLLRDMPRLRSNRDGTFPGPIPQPLLSSVGDMRTFNHTDNLPHATTLKQIETAADGTVVQVWVEDTEYDPTRVTDAMINAIATTFTNGVDAVYPMVTDIAGAPWGVHGFVDLIDPVQPIDIVLLDFNNDNLPWGTVGYFWARNNIKVGTQPLSNESLSFYLDTETLHLAADPVYALQFEISALAHEFVHMINFYQRAVLLDNSYDDWMEEMSAMMMEDIVSQRVDPAYNTVRDARFPAWLANSTFNCELVDWQTDEAACFGYNVAGSFGGHLLRHLGVAFYQGLLGADTSTDSLELLEDALVAAGSTLKDEVRRWGAASALLPPAMSPVGFGMPEVTESGHTLPAIDQPYYESIRELPDSGAELQPLGHFPMSRLPTADQYQEYVDVPPGAALTVIVK